MKEIRKKISEQTQKSLQKFVDDNPDLKKQKHKKNQLFNAKHKKTPFKGVFLCFDV